MPKNDLFDFDATTSANNTDVEGANVAEGCAASGINNAIRGLAAIVKRALGSQGAAIASAATTNIGAAGTALYTTVTGTTTITSFGTVAAGTFRIIEFTGILTLTHNAASLKLPGSANITTAAGDIAFLVSLGSGNWKCLHYSKADGSPVAGGFSGTLTSTDAGATEGPSFTLFRDSASPAANDVMGALRFSGRDSGAGVEIYGAIYAEIADPTAGLEDGRLRIRTRNAGADADWVIESGNLIAPSQIGKGLGTINASGLYIAGHGTIAQAVRDVDLVYSSSATAIPQDNTIPQNTEGVEIMSVAITPTNASSTIRVRAGANLGSSGAGLGQTMALFKDTGANALAAAGHSSNNSITMDCVSLEYAESAGSTSARTYKIRVGQVSGTVYINGNATTRIYGGVSICWLEVEEILPQ